MVTLTGRGDNPRCRGFCLFFHPFSRKPSNLINIAPKGRNHQLWRSFWMLLVMWRCLWRIFSKDGVSQSYPPKNGTCQEDQVGEGLLYNITMNVDEYVCNSFIERVFWVKIWSDFPQVRLMASEEIVKHILNFTALNHCVNSSGTTLKDVLKVTAHNHIYIYRYIYIL